jgi:hypothetical protein
MNQDESISAVKDYSGLICLPYFLGALELASKSALILDTLLSTDKGKI